MDNEEPTKTKPARESDQKKPRKELSRHSVRKETNCSMDDGQTEENGPPTPPPPNSDGEEGCEVPSSPDDQRRPKQAKKRKRGPPKLEVIESGDEVCRLCGYGSNLPDDLELGPLYRLGVCQAHFHCLMFSSNLVQVPRSRSEIFHRASMQCSYYTGICFFLCLNIKLKETLKSPHHKMI